MLKVEEVQHLVLQVDKLLDLQDSTRVKDVGRMSWLDLEEDKWWQDEDEVPLHQEEEVLLPHEVEVVWVPEIRVPFKRNHLTVNFQSQNKSPTKTNGIDRQLNQEIQTMF